MSLIPIGHILRTIVNFLGTRSTISPNLQVSLEAQAIKEGLLSREDYIYSDIFNFPKSYAENNAHEKILTYLCLFPEIDMTQSDFTLDNVQAKTGLKLQKIESRFMRKIYYQNTEIYDDFDKILNQCNIEASSIFLNNASETVKIISSMINYQNLNQNKTELFYQNRSFIPAIELLSSWYENDVATSPWRNETGAEEIIRRETNFGSEILLNPDFEAWLDKVDDHYVRMLSILFEEKISNKSAITERWWRFNRNQINTDRSFHDRALDVGHMVAINFRDELRVVPTPRSIPEAIEMAHTKEMIRLREKISEWSEAATSSSQLEARVRKDIEKASKEIKNLNSYKEFKESPLVFGIRLLLGQVPIISNLLSVIEAAEWATERWLKQKNIWVSVK